ncbi:MAG TPA: lysine biosynthesis protein LysW [Chloroflexota bacterium]|nr:lysine biosynthesis protein LysW [Chloroflexota bacterium]
MTAECPECAAAIPMDGVVQGELLRCPDCGADLEVTSLQPPVLALAPSEEEDWGE